MSEYDRVQKTKESLSDWLQCNVTAILGITTVIDVQSQTIDEVIKNIQKAVVTERISFRLIGTSLIEVSI